MSDNCIEVPLSLKMMIQNLPEIAYAFSEEGKLLTWNKNAEKITGFSKDDLKNKFVSELIYKEDKDRVLKKFMQLLTDDDKERNIEYSLQTKSGKLIPLFAMRSLVVLEGKKYIIGIAINKSKVYPRVESFDDQLLKIKNLKDQLEEHYLKIEELRQREILLKEELFFNTNAFNSKLIDSMPGIFYAYEKVGEQFFLKKWNSNYTTDLGYPEEELLNMQPDQFFTKEEFEKVKEGISQIFVTGNVRQENYTTHKNGKQIPYFYEAYLFEDKGRKYFVGIGLDVSRRYAAEKKNKRQEIEKQKLNLQLEIKKRDLVSLTLQESKTNEIINKTVRRVDNILKENTDVQVCNNLYDIKKDLIFQINRKDNWEVFKLRFGEVHKDFFKNLKTKHPKLTESELKFCAYLKIRLPSHRIASILNISYEGVKKSRYRIRKKLDLSTKDSLEDYILVL